MERRIKWEKMTAWLETNDIQFVPDFSKYGDKADEMTDKYQLAWKGFVSYTAEITEGEEK